MKKICFLCLMAALALSCIKGQQETVPSITDDPIFHGTIDNMETRVYVDNQLRVLWNADDRVSIFNKTTYNRQYLFMGQDGDNSGSFRKVVSDEFVTGNPLNYIYSVYPYNESTKVNNDGDITVTLPSIQVYREDSFGLKANTMIAITEDDELVFKNLCGYFAIRLYGDNINVKSISIKGNNNEFISGPAKVIATLNAVPTLQFESTLATKEISLICDNPVLLGSSDETATVFWFVIPPTFFENGITVTVTDDGNRVFEKVTSGSLEIKRSVLKNSSALQVIYSSIPETVPEAIDLGLSVKWASCNIGATKPEEYGDFFAWGETKPKNVYSWATYKWCNGSSTSLTKYNTQSTYGTVDNKTTLEPEDDAATTMYGNEWRMPTYLEFQELKTQCSWKYSALNGHSGYLVTGPNGNSIFMPTGGNSEGFVGWYGCYWGADLGTTTDQYGCNFDFTSSFTDLDDDWRYYGRCIRAVNSPKTPESPEDVPEAIDLGLSVKWASHNVGATTPEEYGNYYAWGETKPKEEYSWATYKWCDGSANTLTKYNTRSSYGIVDNKKVLDPEDDVASTEYGGEWRMPTYNEFKELQTQCSWEYTNNAGHNGYIVTGPNGKSIFLPSAGNSFSASYAEYWGCYWGSDLGTTSDQYGCNFDFTSSFTDLDDDWRYYGRCIRAVNGPRKDRDSEIQ